MALFYTNRILTRQFIDTSTFAGGLNTVADATPNQSMLGNSTYVTDGTYSLSFRYVKLATASLGALVVNAPVYFTDAAKQTVNSDPTLALTYVVSTDSGNDSCAGLLMNASSPVAAGYGVWVQTGGYLAAIPSPGSVVKGDRLVLSANAGTAATINVFTRIAAGTSPSASVMATLYVISHTSVASSLINGWVCGNCALP